MRLPTSYRVAALASILVLSAPYAQAQSSGTMDHSKMQMNMTPSQTTMKSAKPGMATGMPTEPGQGAFATISEIVDILVNDPDTDWSKVNINVLREHLVDMSEVTLRAKAETETAEDRVTFKVTGSGRTLQAIQAMVLAHAPVMDAATAWEVRAEKTPDGANMTLISDKPASIKLISALGFFGIMGMGAHHQPHHLGMARGVMVHGG